MNTSNEIWEPVKGYEGCYEVSNTGKIMGIERMVVTKSGLRIIKSRLLKPRLNNYGYMEVRLTKNGKTTTTFIHIIIARSFIPNPLNKLEINHVNGIKTDNRIENLEWCTHLENMQHASLTGLLKRTYKQVVDNCTGRTYISSYEAALDLNLDYATLKNYLNGNRTNKTCLEYLT